MYPNRYQAFFFLSIAFLVFVCFRSYSPYPAYKIPRTQTIKAEPLPDPEVSMEAILEQKPHWLSTSRNLFQVHPEYIQKVIKPVEKTPGKPTPPQARIIALAPPHPPEIIKPTPSPVKVTPPPPPLSGGGNPPPPPPGSGNPPGGNQSSEPEQPVEPPYELPFVFQGIVLMGESGGGPMVILKDKETGRVVRRSEGQTIQGVHIRKIAPNSVEVEVPAEGLQFRYVDNLRQWVSL